MNQLNLEADTLDQIQRAAFHYFFRHEVNSENGLVADQSQAGSPASIATVGLALSAYPIGVERGFITRSEAIERTLATLRFLHLSVQGDEPGATGYKGFYYHLHFART